MAGEGDLTEREGRFETGQGMADYAHTTQPPAFNNNRIRKSTPLKMRCGHTSIDCGTDSAFARNFCGEQEGVVSTVSQLPDGCYKRTKSFMLTMDKDINLMHEQGNKDVLQAHMNMARLSEIEIMLLSLNTRWSRLISEEKEKATSLRKPSRAFPGGTSKSYGVSNTKSQSSVGSIDSGVPSLGKSDSTPCSQSTATTTVNVTRGMDELDASYQVAEHDMEACRPKPSARRDFGSESSETNRINTDRSKWGSMGKVHRQFVLTDISFLPKSADAICLDARPRDNSRQVQLGKSRQPSLQGLAVTGTDKPKTLAECQISVKSQKTTDAKLNMIIGILGNISVPPTEAGPRRFFFRIQKIARCLQSCHNGNLDSFCTTNPKLDVARYNCPNGHDHRLKGKKS